MTAAMPRKKSAVRKPVTIRHLIQDAARRFAKAKLFHGHGTSEAMDEAVFLVMEALHLPLERLPRLADKPLTADQQRRVAEAVAARISTRKPAAYIVRRAYIQGVPFYVDERAIVPRSFIGELLFSGLFNGALISDPTRVKRVLDLCTGSGCLAVLAAMVFPNAKVDAVDLSAPALGVARINVDLSGFKKRVILHEGDLFAPLSGKRYDLIISNPPYVDAKAMAVLPREYRHEPELALAGGDDGLILVRRIIDEAHTYLTPNGALLCEVGAGREGLEAAYPRLPFFWLDTAESSGEVFWLEASALKSPRR